MENKTESVKRNTAYKVWIADVISSQYFRGQEQFESGYINLKGNKISRVNVLGSVVDKFTNENSVSFNLDDGSGVLKLRTWNENVDLFSDVNIGDIVLVIGKVKEYNHYIYVTPEVIKKLENPLWLKVRKLELIKLYGEVERIDNVVEDNFNNLEVSEDDVVMNVVEEKVSASTDNSREFILTLIEKLDFGDGADLDEVVKSAAFNGAGTLISDLLREGEIFELHKGKLRVTG